MKKELIKLISLLILVLIIAIITLVAITLGLGYLLYNLSILDLGECQTLAFFVWCILVYKSLDYLIKRYA